MYHHHMMFEGSLLFILLPRAANQVPKSMRVEEKLRTSSSTWPRKQQMRWRDTAVMERRKEARERRQNFKQTNCMLTLLPLGVKFILQFHTFQRVKILN